MGSTTPIWGLSFPGATDAPDGPGGLYALAQTVEAMWQRRCTLQRNGASAAGTSGVDISWDTINSDPNSMRHTDGQSIKALWTGRYRIGCRFAVSSASIPTSATASIDCVDSGSGAVYGQVGQNGLPADIPMQYWDELTFTAGAIFRFRAHWSDGVSRSLSYGADSTRARIFAQYLGPA